MVSETNKYLSYIIRIMTKTCSGVCIPLQHVPKMIGHKYTDHSYCSTCVRWFLKSQHNVKCPCCHLKLRHRAKYGGAREKEVLA